MAKKKKSFQTSVVSKAESFAPEKRRSLPLIFWGILFAAAVVKALYLKASQSSPFYEPNLLDPQYYHRWAMKIAGGDWVGEGVFYGLPLYPYFLALCYKVFGVSVPAVKILQGLLGLLTLFFVYKIGEKLKGQTVGLIAMGLAAFYGPLFFHEGIFIPEALSVPLYAGGFFALWLFEEKPTLKRGALVGFILGLATLTKAGLILFIVAFSVFRWIRPAQTGPGPRKAVLALLAAFFMTLSPVTLHNVVFGKDLVWLTSHAGFNFYVGNNPRSEGVFVAPEGTGSNVDSQIRDSKAVAERESGRALRSSEVSRYWSDKAWGFIRENPQAFLQLCGRKLLIFFDSREISDVDDYQFLKSFVPFLNFPWLDFSILGPLVFLGLLLSVRRTRQASLIYFWVGSYLLGLAAFFVNARYRLPLLGVFFPIAASGLMDLFEALRRREALKIGLSALALGAGIWVGQMKLIGTDWSRDYVNAGDVYLEKNDFEKARGFYDEALRIDPRSAKAHLAMGILFSKQGRQEEAKGYYLKAVEEDPRNAQAFNNLGFWYDKEGDLETARSYFLKALDLNPDSSYAHNNLGMIYGKSGDNEKAVKEFEASLKINPRSARAHTNLGLVQYRLGRVEEAKASWRKALEVDPGFAEARRALSALQNTPISFDTT